jgi:Xaa-Pro dipeptidase
MARRWAALEGLLGEEGCDAALVYGAERAGTAVPWLTGWPVTREAALVVRAGEAGVMWVCYDNHVPNARAMAWGVEVRAGGRPGNSCWSPNPAASHCTTTPAASPA